MVSLGHNELMALMRYVLCMIHVRRKKQLSHRGCWNDRVPICMCIENDKSKWKLTVPPVKTKLSNWRPFVFSVGTRAFTTIMITGRSAHIRRTLTFWNCINNTEITNNEKRTIYGNISLVCLHKVSGLQNAFFSWSRSSRQRSEQSSCALVIVFMQKWINRYIVNMLINGWHFDHSNFFNKRV